jgi:hypothetical protein
MKCNHDKKIGEACTGNKEYVPNFRHTSYGRNSELVLSEKTIIESDFRADFILCDRLWGDRCQSYWCVDNKCHKAAGDPRRPGVWVYPVVAICIALRESYLQQVIEP